MNNKNKGKDEGRADKQVDVIKANILVRKGDILYLYMYMYMYIDVYRYLCKLVIYTIVLLRQLPLYTPILSILNNYVLVKGNGKGVMKSIDSGLLLPTHRERMNIPDLI